MNLWLLLLVLQVVCIPTFHQQYLFIPDTPSDEVVRRAGKVFLLGKYSDEEELPSRFVSKFMDRMWQKLRRFVTKVNRSELEYKWTTQPKNDVYFQQLTPEQVERVKERRKLIDEYEQRTGDKEQQSNPKDRQATNSQDVQTPSAR
jgi:hypothetical protein